MLLETYSLQDGNKHNILKQILKLKHIKMALFKDLYSKEFYEQLSDILNNIYPKFNKQSFIRDIFSSDFEEKELKERMRHTTIIIHNYLPNKYLDSLEIFNNLIEFILSSANESNRLPYMFIPDYIEVYGIDDYNNSIKALEKITQFVSCEFAVRPFILKYNDKMINQMIEWSLHDNVDVRRLASEGSRPRLPWAISLPFLKNDPTPIFPILENLKNDPSDYVRRSVANNLNDISKDNPQITINFAERWIGNNKNTDWIIKHSCRTLLKQGNNNILELYGLDSKELIVTNLKIKTKSITSGENLFYSFELNNTKETKQVVRIEYGIYYMKANGQHSRKVFKISEKILNAKEKVLIERKHPFKVITTRKFYSGEHKVSIIINGKESLIDSFHLNHKTD